MRRIAPLILLLALAVGVPADRAAAATLPTDAYIGADGHGFGHGRGMGQWGAKGLADQGKAWTDILSHYYSGTTLATRSPETIRVLVEDSADILVTAKAPFSVWWSGGTKIADSSAAQPFLRALYSSSGLSVQRAAAYGGPWTTITSGAGPVVFKPGTDWLGLVLSTGGVRYYRGEIEARKAGTSLLGINNVGIEPYLYGVVPREVPASWDGDVLRAQAVAARSYAATKKDAARAAGKLYDICATTSCQVYSGYASANSPSETPKLLESASTNTAVNDTAGKVLTYGGKPILAEYSSSSGGYTANSSQPYMKAVADPADSVSPYHNWTTRVSVGAIQVAWPAIGSLVDVRITKRNGYGDYGGRVTEMIVQGTSSSVTITGGTFRSKLGLRSDWFRLRIYRGDLVASSASVSGPAGAAIPVSVSLKNTGNVEWRVGGTEVLATWNPSGRRSAFAATGWIDDTKPTAVTRNASRSGATTVGPGETAEFRFTLDTAGLAPGLYSESFRPLKDGVTWMPDVGIKIAVSVLSSWQEEAGNVTTNGSFEAGWSSWRGSGVNGSDGPATGIVRDGNRSMHLAAGGRKAVVQSLSMAGGARRRVVLGGWARTTGSNSGGGPVALNLALRNTDGTITWNQLDFGRGAHDWQYMERVVVSAKPFNSADLYALFYDQAGHVYFDAVRVLDTHLANPSFEMGTGSWIGAGLGAGDGPSTSVVRDGFRSMHFAGGTKSLSQRIPIRGPAGRFYHVAGWTKADQAGAAGVTAATSIIVVFNNLDGSTSRTTIAAPAGDHDWTYAERHVAATKHFVSIDIVAAVLGQTGSIFFDGLRLRENRLPNGSFEAGIEPWTGTGAFSAADGVVDALSRDASKSLKIAAASGKDGVIARIASGGGSGVSLFIGGWSKTTGSGGQVWLSAGFRNTDGTTTWRNLFFPSSAHDWVHQETLVRSAKPYSSIDVYAIEDGQPGDAYFDGITLWSLA